MTSRKQVTNSHRLAGVLKDVNFNNKHMSTEAKVRIYKCVTPIVTHEGKTRADDT